MPFDLSDQFQRNPFVYTKPINDRSKFIGRQDLVDRIFARLANGQSVSIVGERRIGKTSFLNFLKDSENRREHGLGPDKAIFVSADFQAFPLEVTPAQFWAAFLRDAADQILDPEIKSQVARCSTELDIETRQVGNVLDRLIRTYRRVVLLLDEIEGAAGLQHLERTIFDSIRSLVGSHGLTVVAASRQGLDELGSQARVVSSPFFNAFAEFHLTLFDKQETETLVAKYLAETGATVSFAEEQDLILEMGGRHPCFTQMACYFLYEAYARGCDAHERKTRVIGELEKELSSHFSYFWEHSTLDEKSTLLGLALDHSKRGKIEGDQTEPRTKPRPSQQILQSLQRRSLVVSRDGNLKLFTPLFGGWIQVNGLPLDDQTSVKDEASVIFATGGHTRPVRNDAKSVQAANRSVGIVFSFIVVAAVLVAISADSGIVVIAGVIALILIAWSVFPISRRTGK